MFKFSKITVGTFLLTLKISITCRNKNDKNDSAIRVMKERAKAFANILWNRTKRKFQRDKIDLEKALNSSNKFLQQLMNNKTRVLNEKLREKLLEIYIEITHL